jgi:hypothetical protein
MSGKYKRALLDAIGNHRDIPGAAITGDELLQFRGDHDVVGAVGKTQPGHGIGHHLPAPVHHPFDGKSRVSLGARHEAMAGIGALPVCHFADHQPHRHAG